MPNESSKPQQVGAQTDEPPLAEWIVAAIGFVLVIAAIGFLLYRALAGSNSPPMIAVHQQSVIATPSGYLVEIRVINSGGMTAAEVLVEGELKNGAETIETSEATIDYVPARSEKRGGLYFSADPRRHQLQIKAKGYRHP
ncbi:MAG TPA: TIGR02588 family protein [Casimicrobiaceae bacterium]|nr:TIGR02588 family protein [Casimicrobiaceae bacterium]